jgi:hypothetical protein
VSSKSQTLIPLGVLEKATVEALDTAFVSALNCASSLNKLSLLIDLPAISQASPITSPLASGLILFIATKFLLPQVLML